MRIEWPSGVVQTLTNLAPKQILTILEHQQNGVSHPKLTEVSRTVVGSVNLSAVGDTGAMYLFEASTNLVNWGWLGVRSNVTGTFQLSDLLATNYISRRFYRVSAP